MSQLRSIIKNLPGIGPIVNSLFYRRLRNSYTLATESRTTLKTFTRFNRVPRQFDALAGPAVDYVFDSKTNKPLKIIVLGCSKGAEVWTIVSTLINKRPDISFHVYAYDISREMLDRAKEAVYTDKELFTHDQVTQEFVSSCFEKDGKNYRVKGNLLKYASFAELDIFTPDLPGIVGKSDILFIQNILYNFSPSDSRRAFHNIHPIMKEKSVLFLEGMDIGQRSNLTRKYGLQPLDFMIEEIHDDARIVRGEGWPYNYWGLEPFDKSRSNWKRFYATIFLKGLSEENKR